MKFHRLFVIFLAINLQSANTISELDSILVKNQKKKTIDIKKIDTVKASKFVLDQELLRINRKIKKIQN